MNRKAGIQLTASFIVSIVIIALAFWGVSNVYGGIFEGIESDLNGGYACLTTLKAQQYTSSEKEVIGSLSVNSQLFFNKCSTINNVFYIEKDFVPKPRDKIENQVETGLKMLADRLAFVWWMTGAGTVPGLWADKKDDKGIFTVAWTNNKPGVTTDNRCVTFMNFDIKDSKYFPTVEDDVAYPLNSQSLLNYMKAEDYKPIVKDGQQQIMKYYEYITLAGGEDSGSFILLPTKYEPDKTYSIALMKMPADEDSFLEVFATSCSLSVGLGATSIWTAKAALGSLAIPVVGPPLAVVLGVVSITSGYYALDGASVCATSTGQSLDDYFTLKESKKEVNKMYADHMKETFFQKFTKEDFERLNETSILLMGPQSAIQKLGCVEIKLGEATS